MSKDQDIAKLREAMQNSFIEIRPDSDSLEDLMEFQSDTQEGDLVLTMYSKMPTAAFRGLLERLEEQR